MIRLACAVFLSVLSSCKTAEKQSNVDLEHPVRYDGIYIAENHSATPANSNGVPIDGKKSILILRFYDNSSGVIIPETIESSQDLENDTIMNAYFKWAKDFELRNPKDKDFVNFMYRVKQDSIEFAQRSPEITYEYSGRSFSGDSIYLDLKFRTEYGAPGKGRLLTFRFYPAM